jgi:phage protein, HK97 gp10 family
LASTTITVTGLKEVQKRLYSYSQQLGDRVVLGALRQGANLVKKVAQENAPVKTGKLKRGIRVTRSKIHRGKSSRDMIGVYLSVRKGKSGPYYAKFQEDGWKAGKRLIPGKKFIDRAFIEKREEAAALIIKAASASADLLARKIGL